MASIFSGNPPSKTYRLNTGSFLRPARGNRAAITAQDRASIDRLHKAFAKYGQEKGWESIRKILQKSGIDDA